MQLKSKEMKSFKHSGKLWKIHSEKPTKLVLVPAGNPLADWRKKKKLTQRDAAKALGVTQGQIARIENGTRICAPEILTKLI